LKMFAKNRQDKIYEHIQKFGAATTADLVKEYSVSVETIRRDLLFMEEQGLLKRVHGGAVANSDMKKFYNLQERNKEFSDEKRNLSLNAAGFVKEGDIIFLDQGSTAISFAQILKEKFSSDTPFLKKRLLTEWKTGLSLSKRSFANYEGMCLGPMLEDGSQVVILLSDSQDQYAGVLKDWFKTIVIRKE